MARENRKIEFIARTVTDLGKGITVVGVASYFFEKLPLPWRLSIGLLSITMIFIVCAYKLQHRHRHQKHVH